MVLLLDVNRYVNCSFIASFILSRIEKKAMV